MTKVISQTYNVTMEYRAKLTWAALVICAFLALFYSWNLYKVIASTVALHRIEVDKSKLTGSLDGLDAQYLALSDKITPDALKSHGMTQVSVTEYIPRNASIGRVAMLGHEL